MSEKFNAEGITRRMTMRSATRRTDREVKDFMLNWAKGIAFTMGYWISLSPLVIEIFRDEQASLAMKLRAVSVVARVNHKKCFSSRSYFYKSARNKPSINGFLLMIRLLHHAVLNLCQGNLSLKEEYLRAGES